ncbi:MAG TPA: septation regulator SpoVG [Candidatus Merdivicinus intestinavium]|nr:septation regulator SpoVG [Candidatus Merdivicinus intestinavium]
MNITDIKIRKLMREGRLRAVVSVTLDNELAIHDIKVIEGPDRLFVAMPSRKETNGAFRDIVHPISPAARLPFEQAVLDAYRRELASRSAEETAHPAFAASASLFPSAGFIPKYY